MSGHFREDQVKRATTLRELMVQLWPLFMRQKLLFWSVVFAILGLAALGRLIPTIFGYAVDHGIMQKDFNVLAICAAIYLVVEILKSWLLFLHSYLFGKLGNRTLFELRSQMIEHTQSLPIPFFDKNPTGRIVTRVTSDLVSLGELFTQGIVQLFSNLISLAAIVIAMSLISLKMTLVTLLIAPPVIWIAFRLGKAVRLVLRESKRKLAAINAYVAESISGMRVLQLYNRLAPAQARFDELSKDYRVLQMRSVVLYALLWPTVNFFNAASVAVALYYGGVVTAADAISAGSMIAFILHVRDFIHPLRTILEKYQLFQNSLSGAERVFTLLEEPRESVEPPVPLPARLRGEIRFDHLSFRYDSEHPLVLRDLSLTIQPRQSVAIVGRTGSGKTTIISLLQRFYDYKEGEILLDGHRLRDLPRQEVRRRVGVVQQDQFIFRGTIAENIALARTDLSAEQVRSAARRAHCEYLLARDNAANSAGANSVDERGANLSAGERQLLAFARALAFDPDVLILDEATANIDSHSESLIQAATREIRRDRTCIIIAHRISTIVDCDQIIVLDDGRIVEQGTHSELLARQGHYYELCRAQFGLTEAPSQLLLS